MSWLTFGIQTSPEPMSNLDVQFLNVASFGIVNCTASGTNVITLTPTLSGYTGPAYANYVTYRFVAANTSTGAVTLKIGSLSALVVYNQNGTSQVGSGGIVAGQLYCVSYYGTLNSSAGGWFLSAQGFTNPFVGTLTITPPTGLSQALNTSQTGTGSPLALQEFNKFLVVDSVDCGTASDVFSSGWVFQHNFGGSSARGGRLGLNIYSYLTAPLAAGNNNKYYVALNASMTAQAAETGGQIFGAGIYAQATSAAVGLAGVIGGEVNTSIATGATASWKIGWAIVQLSTDLVQGTTRDAAIALSNQTGAVGWNDGILIDDAAGVGAFAIKSNGNLIRSTSSSTVANGIDISSLTITTSAFKSSQFKVSGAGVITAGTYTNQYGQGTILSSPGSPTYYWESSTFSLQDDRSMAAGVGGGLVLLGNYITGTGSPAGFAGIQARKVNSTSTDATANLDIWTRSGYIRFLSNGTISSGELARISAAGGLSVNTTSDPGAGMIYTNSASFIIRTKTSYSNGAAAQTATMTNGPAAGNPTKWIPVDDNGTTRYIPSW